MQNAGVLFINWQILAMDGYLKHLPKSRQIFSQTKIATPSWTSGLTFSVLKLKDDKCEL